jgi:phasin family protein
MVVIPEQFSRTTTAQLADQLDTLNTLGSKTFDSVEQLIDLNLGLLRAALEDSAESARQLCAAKSAQEFFAVGAAQVKPLNEKLLTYGRHLADIAASARSDLSEATESRVIERNRNVLGMVETAAKNAPAGSEQAVALIRTAVGTANAGYEQFSKTTRQAVEAIEVNLAAVVGRLADTKEKHSQRARK